MSPGPDDRKICRCGRSTYAVPDDDSQRTCSKCGYLATYCKCEPVFAMGIQRRLNLLALTDKGRAMIGVAVISALTTLFAVTLFASPFFAVFGLGIPLGLAASFFIQWLREPREIRIAKPLAVAERKEEEAQVNTR